MGAEPGADVLMLKATVVLKPSREKFITKKGEEIEMGSVRGLLLGAQIVVNRAQENLSGRLLNPLTGTLRDSVRLIQKPLPSQDPIEAIVGVPEAAPTSPRGGRPAVYGASHEWGAVINNAWGRGIRVVVPAIHWLSRSLEDAHAEILRLIRERSRGALR